MSSIDIQANRLAVEKKRPMLIEWYRKAILKSLEKLQVGHLTVIDGKDIRRFGDSKSRLSATIRVKNRHCYGRILLGGTIGVGESFMFNWWETDSLLNVVRIFVSNRDRLNNMETPISRIGKSFHSLWEGMRKNSIHGSKRNIGAHYDLNNDFFSLFLDATMMYSSAIYKDDTQSLLDASLNKLDHICQRLALKPEDHVLEIGTGWGGLAIYAAKHYGCRVTTTTISDEQYNYAKEMVKKEGLENQITLLKQDYRLLYGKYDKLVSIEMIEAVGYQYYKEYFTQCHRLLKDDGLMLIQAITTQDQRFPKEKHKIDFIRRYIFPGGCLPSNEEILKNTRKYTELHLIGLDDITLDYAKTLNAWRENFLAHIDDVRQMGYSETFIRMWEFYLCYCEGGFAERVINTSQLLFAKPQSKTLPLVS